MKKTNKLFLLILFCFVFALIATTHSSAELLKTDTHMGGNLLHFAKDAGYNTLTGDSNYIALEERIGNIIQIILGFVGTLFLILIIWSGFQWMTAGGNADTLSKAKQRIINAVIGLVIVLAAYSITWFVTEKVLSVTSTVTQTEPTE